MWQQEFASLLQEQLRKHRMENPNFSVRTYAKRLGLSPGGLSTVLRGHKRWGLTGKRAAEILEKIEVTPAVKNRLLVKMGESPKHQTQKLSETDHQILLDWTYFPILFSFDLPQPLCTPTKIANRLGLPVAKVKEVIAELLRRGFLKKSAAGKISRPETFVMSTDGTPSETIRKYHEANMDCGLKALEALPAKRRDFTALTFVGSEKQLEVLRDEIRKLHAKASSIMAGAEQENDNVFRLSVQLYPMEFKE